jgi:hypothetical protein
MLFSSARKIVLASITILVSYFLMPVNGCSQHLKGSAEAGAYLGTGSSLPFLMRANQFGTVPLIKPTFAGRAGLHYSSQDRSADSTQNHPHHHLSWEVKSQIVFNLGPEAKQVLLPEAFGKVRWKKMEVWAGRRQEVIGIVDTTLTSGSFTWSGNALPVPKVQIGFPEYVTLPFLKNYIAFKGFFAHGWYNTPYIQGAYLHQKALHIRLGKPEWKFNIEAGLVHHVTWGGHAEYLKSSPHAVNGKLTSSFKDYVRGVVLGRISKEFHNNRFTNFDGENRVGNHIGQFDFALEYKLKSSVVLLYNNHPFEDASGFLFQNMPDGLYGLSWKKRGEPSHSLFEVRGILAEYLYTKDQGGAGWNVDHSRFKGNDNYFNHQQYVEGWSYFSKGIGTPLIVPVSEIRPEKMGVREFFPSTKVIAYHVGLEGNFLSKTHWQAKVSTSSNFGTNNIVFEPTLRQFSSLLLVDTPIHSKGKVRLLVKIAYDRGDLFVPSLAGYLGVRRSWL